MSDDDDYSDDAYGDTDQHNVPDGGFGQNTSAGDGLPGYPVEGMTGWRAGAFGHPGAGLLGMVREAPFAGPGDSRLMLASNPAPPRQEAIVAPPGVSSQAMVDQMKRERDHYNRLGDEADLTPGQDAPVGAALRNQPFLDWVWKVRPGGEWDFKRLDKSGRRENPYEGFGNSNYMRTGHEGLGISEETLRRAAGLMQEVVGTATGIGRVLHGRPWNPNGYKPEFGHFWQGPPYGDDPRDEAAMPTYPPNQPRWNK